jgi:hypothetical protein
LFKDEQKILAALDKSYISCRIYHLCPWELCKNLIVANMPVIPTTRVLGYAFGNRVYFIPAKGKNLEDFGF